MRSPLNSSSDSSALLPASQQFLIPPFERVRFTVLFILATGFGWFLIWFVLRSVQDPLMPARAIERGLLSALITGLVSGLVVSAMQWLVLRRYLTNWLWILAGTAGYILLTVTLEAGWGWIGILTNAQAVVQLFRQLPPAVVVFTAGGLRVLLTALCAVWLGLTQWLFLRQNTRSNLWWLGVPSIAVLLSSSFTFLSVLLLTAGVKLPLATNVLAAGILGTTQAIALCALKKKTVDLTLRDHTSPLVVAPEIVDYELVKTLARQLQRRLNMAWTSEHLNDDALPYLVGVTQNGAIAAYTPLNSPAVEQLEEIPLPELTHADQAKRRSNTEPLARFEVIFLPSGSLRVNAWLGIPLTWVAVSMMTVVLALSAIAAYSIPHSSLNLQ
uniref:Uncharacterized protein n=1 Tax=Oscillatoriales cyanobacterium SpSt-402 TaxID=2282168 RepID=A0A832H374_9CYAN